MAKRKRRIFTREFKAEAVRLCKVGDRSLAQVARDLDVQEQSLRLWETQFPVEADKSPSDPLSTAERDELLKLRKQVKRLEMEREILKKATAFFAKESE